MTWKPARTVDVDVDALKPILDRLGLKVTQVDSITIGARSLTVHFFAEDSNGHKYLIGEDVARGSYTASINWVTKPAIKINDELPEDVKNFLGEGWEPVT